MNKVMSLDEATSQVQAQQAAGKKVVFANGCFDLLHGGHVAYLADSRQYGDWLIVGVNSDKSERELKGPTRPVIDESARVEILSAIRYVDAIVLFDEATCENLLRTLKPDVHAKGTDYTADTVPERECARELGIEVYIAGPPKENASRGIISTALSRYGK